MIDMNNIGQNFMRREPREWRPGQERYVPGTNIGQQSFAPQAPVAPSLPIGIPTQQPFAPVVLPEREASITQPTMPEIPPIAPPPTAPIIPETGEFPYPEQWQTATDIYGQLAGGMPAITPEYAQQAWLPYQRQGQQEAMQAREQAGLGGLRWSTPLAGRLEDIWGGASERFGSEMERMRMQDIANQRQAMLGAAGGLGGLGGQYAQLPLTVSQTMMGLGGAQQQMQQAELDRYLQEFLRTQPEYSPLLQYQAGGAQMPVGPSMYGPSFGSQMLDIGGQMGLAQMLGLFDKGRPITDIAGANMPPPEAWGTFR